MPDIDFNVILWINQTVTLPEHYAGETIPKEEIEAEVIQYLQEIVRDLTRNKRVVRADQQYHFSEVTSKTKDEVKHDLSVYVDLRDDTSKPVPYGGREKSYTVQVARVDKVQQPEAVE